MKKFAILFFISLFLGSYCHAKNPKFIQVSNVNFEKNKSQELKKLVNDINLDFKNVDFVLFSGDNLKTAKPDELWRFLEIIRKIKPKTYVLAGEKDLLEPNDMTHKNYMYLVRKKLGRHHSPCENYTFKSHGIIFAVMNGTKEYMPSNNGYYKEKELLWLDKTLKKYKHRKVVILQHFPLLDSDDRSANLYRKDDYIEVLNKHNNVISIVSGHYNNNFETLDNNIFHIITGQSEKNLYYKLIEIDKKDNFIYVSTVSDDM